MTPPPRLRDLYAGLWRHARGQRRVLVAAFVLLVSAESVRLAVPWFTGQAINAIQRQGIAGLPAASIDLLLVLGTIALGWALHAPGRILERNVALHVRRAFSSELLERLLQAPLAWHVQQHSGQTAHRVTQSSDALHTFAESQYVYVQNAVMLFGPLIALCLLSPVVGLVAIIGFALLGAFGLRLDRLLIRLSVARNDAERHYQAGWLDTLGNVLTVFALRRFEGARRLIFGRLEALYVPLRKILLLNEAKWAAVDVGGAFIWCSLVALYAWLASRGAPAEGLALGSVFMVYEYARRAENVMAVIAGDFGVMAGQLANYESAQPLLQAPQRPMPGDLAASAWRELTFDELRHRPSLQDRQPLDAAISLRLQRGVQYALIGPSGAGKSTLLRLLCGLDEAATGVIRRDGEPIEAEQLRREATLVPQESRLFAGSIIENLSLGDAPDERRLRSALHDACASEFVDRLDDGLQTRVTEGGSNWSGGQRQRLALARGLIAAAGSSLALFDEPTNGLDAHTEMQAMRRVLATTQDACVVVALHRLSLLPLFDQVIVMDGGRVVDVGQATALHGRCGLFRELLKAGALDDADHPLPAAPADCSVA